MVAAAATFCGFNNCKLQIVGLTSKCGESSAPATQLEVVKALLTYVTGGWVGGWGWGKVGWVGLAWSRELEAAAGTDSDAGSFHAGCAPPCPRAVAPR